jgi:hypothetical protein
MLERRLKSSSSSMMASDSKSMAHKAMANLIYEMLHASTKTHITHLMTTSYAAHKALNKFYDQILGKVDDLAEQYQGHVEMILEYPAQMDIPMLKTPEEAIIYLRNLYDKISSVQSMMTCSSIINTMDEAKALINSTKYKLIFLK